MTLGPPAWSPHATLAEVRKGRTSESSRPSPTSALRSMITVLSSYSRRERLGERDRNETQGRTRRDLGKEGKIRMDNRRDASVSPRNRTVGPEHDRHSVARDLNPAERGALRRDIRASRQRDRFALQPNASPVAGSRDSIGRREKRGNPLFGEGNL